MTLEDSKKDFWSAHSSATWLQILFLLDTVSALFCLTDSYKHHLGLIVLQAVHLGISLFLFALSFGKLKSTVITMTNVLVSCSKLRTRFEMQYDFQLVAFLINSGSLAIVLWEFIENHTTWAQNEHKKYMSSIYLLCRYGVFILIYIFILFILFRFVRSLKQNEKKNNIEKY